MPTFDKKAVWKNNWVAGWGFLVCSLYAPIYPIMAKKFLGKGINKAILLFEKDFSSNYLPEKQTKDFGKHLAKKIIAKPGLAKQWVNQVIRETDKYLSLLAKLAKQKTFSTADFAAFEQGMYRHVPPNLAVKKSVDFLPQKLLKKILSDFEKARVYTEDVYNQVDIVGKQIQHFIAEQSDLPEKLALVLSKEEIKLYLGRKILPDRKILFARTKGVLIFATATGHKIFTGKQKTRLQQLLFKPIKQESLNGTAAYRGVARGLVRVVFDPKKIGIFNKGDVLVTGMTRPEFLPLMLKASAIVTDAGGILSHAAITAREVKKPTIIGTTYATKVLKDGDIIEVDANKGIVKKLR